MERKEDPRERAIALLESQHEFPGPFEFRVVIHPGTRSAALGAIVSAAGEAGTLLGVTERASAQGTYLALRVRLQVERAVVVLDVYEVLRRVQGVITIL